MEANNEINISINISEDLLKRMFGLYASLAQPSPMGIPAAMLATLAGPQPSSKEDTEKPTIGFKPNSSSKETK